MNRRGLMIMAAALAGAATSTLAAAARSLAADPGRVSRIRPAMGTLVSVSCSAPSRNQAEAAVEAAFAAVSVHEKIHSRHDPSTPLSELNRRGKVDAPPELRDIVLNAKAVHRLTDGAYDPSILPLVNALATAHGLDDPALRRASRLCDFEKVRVGRRAITLAESGMGLTLDSMAKGRILDMAAKAVRGAGVKTFLIEAGGDILAETGPEAKRPWRVALADPVPGNHGPLVTEITRGALATSGGYETASGPRGRTHHIVSPATRACPNALAQATVFAPTAEEADALSTAVFVMGPARGMRLVASLPGRECLLLTASGAKAASPGFKA